MGSAPHALFVSSPSAFSLRLCQPWSLLLFLVAALQRFCFSATARNKLPEDLSGLQPRILCLIVTTDLTQWHVEMHAAAAGGTQIRASPSQSQSAMQQTIVCINSLCMWWPCACLIHASTVMAAACTQHLLVLKQQHQTAASVKVTEYILSLDHSKWGAAQRFTVLGLMATGIRML